MKIVSHANLAAVDNRGGYDERLWTFRRVAAVVAALCVVVFCWKVDQVQLSSLFEPAARAALFEFVRGLFPPDLSPEFLRIVFRAVAATLGIAIAGTTLSILFAIPLGMLATPTLWRRGILAAAENDRAGAALRAWGSRGVFAILGFLRAIPDLVWGLLFVAAVGLGSLAGALALAVAYAGVLGRVYAYVFADVDPRPLEALQAVGATRTQIFLRGIWPQALPNVLAYTLYSFECCVRAASVLGFVGAGGIGYEISLSMRLFAYGQVTTLILAFVLLLGTTDLVSRELRGRLQSKGLRLMGRDDAILGGGGKLFAFRAFGLGVLVAVLAGSFYLAGFTPEHLSESNSLRNIWRFGRGMLPPDFARVFVSSLGPLVVQTLAISILGTLIGIVIGGVLAIPATSSLVFVRADSPGKQSKAESGVRLAIFWVARLILNLLRSIPDLVWVLICIVVVGIGPFAGTLAIGVHTAGVLGKLYAETLEEVAQPPVEALRGLGAGPLQLLAWAIWPQAKKILAAHTVLRWETNLRISAILGLVGGGGLGQAIYNNVQLGFYSRLATLLLVIYVLVIASDWIGDHVSRRTVGV